MIITAMKKSLLTTILVTATICLVSSCAQPYKVTQKPKNFLPEEEMPDASKFLPSPPGFHDIAFLADSIVYVKGKQLRDTERGKVAVEDASTTVEYIMKRFSPAMEVRLTPEEYPVLALFIGKNIRAARSSIRIAKDYFHRERPYQYFEEPTPIPEDEAKNDFTSYPSGHTIRYWMAALVLASIDPEHQEAIFKTGYECGQSRTIVGYHYQSDVDAARLAASASFARLSANPAWCKALKKARKEFQRGRDRERNR